MPQWGIQGHLVPALKYAHAGKHRKRKTTWYRCLQTQTVSFTRLFALVGWQSIKWGVTDTEGDTQIYTRVYTNTRYFRRVNSRKWQNVFKTTCACTHTHVLIESLHGQCKSECTRAWWCGRFWNRWRWARAGFRWIKYYDCAILQC